jgi:hypothetical protein
MKQLTASDLARDYGFTARHWTRLAASGAWCEAASRVKWSVVVRRPRFSAVVEIVSA